MGTGDGPDGTLPRVCPDLFDSELTAAQQSMATPIHF